MTCPEFQRVLPYIIETGGNADEEEHLQECSVCSDLVRDLRYIAEQAKLLVPMEDPNPRVWDGIQKSLEREGLVKGKGLSRSTTVLRVGVLAAAGVLSLFLLSETKKAAAPLGPQLADSVTDDAADVQLLAAVNARQPQLRPTYEQSLRDVNRYIREARERVQSNPDDDSAQQHLMQAYDQKAVLYEMATSQSLP